MDGMWIIKWYIKRVCCLLPAFEKKVNKLQFARLNIPTFIPDRNKIKWYIKNPGIIKRGCEGLQTKAPVSDSTF